MIELLNSYSNLTLITNANNLSIQHLFTPVVVPKDCIPSVLPYDWQMQDRPNKAIVNYHNFEKIPPKAPPVGICIPYVESHVTYYSRIGELIKAGHCN